MTRIDLIANEMHQQAVAVLDHLIRTGKVDWKVARAAEGSEDEVVAEGTPSQAGSGSAS